MVVMTQGIALGGGAIDDRVLRELLSSLCQDDADCWRSFIREFVQDAGALVAAIGSASAAGDAVTLRRASHTLKSTAAMFGAIRLARLSTEIEGLAVDERLDEAETTRRRLVDEFGAVATELASKL
jgi:HPt (histidine-containing phosphotransfer) domain-containing protein